MNDFAAVIFDMDGVIVDSEPLHARAFEQVFGEMGCGETHGMDFEAYYGRSDRALWDDFIARHHPPQSFEELAAWKRDRFLKLLTKEQPIFAPVPDLLAKLSRRYLLALASGSIHTVIDEVLAMRNLGRFFPVVVSVEDVGRGKPAPDVFLRTANLLGVPPRKCWVVEDAPAGIEAARAAGMSVIAITNTLPAAKLSGATHVVGDYAELERLLLPEE
ncbi:MAG: HAD family phosphatase [Candidatus Omnitrophica bacterium]|nr:HAD family phosphatase [Candidatus Omnitrophota bacterium]